MNPILHDLQNKQWIWTGARAKQQASQTKLSTGFNALDKVLSGGFPKAGMIHLQSVLGCGEMRLMLSVLQHSQLQHPSLQQSLQQSAPQQSLVQTSSLADHKLYILIDPPFELNAEFLLAQKIALNQLVVLRPKNKNDALWSAEQCAKSGACHAIFVWQQNLSHIQVRKLEVATQQGNCYCIWMQNTDQSAILHKGATSNLPLTLSLSIQRENDQLSITVNKQKVGWAQKAVHIPLPFTCHTNRLFKQRLQQNKTHKVVSINANR